MTDRVIITAADDLDTVLDALGRAAATRGWRVEAPEGARQDAARAAVRALRLPQPVVVTLVADAADAEPVDAAALLRAHPVPGAVPDAVRRRIPPPRD